MHLIRFLASDGSIRLGKKIDERQAVPLHGDIFGVLHPQGAALPIARLLAPIDPPNIFAIGQNYREHAEEMKAAALPVEPLIFLKATTSLIGPDEPIILPRSAPEQVDFEAELAVVIGRTVRNVSETEALDFVLGYTCANDVSARDCQKVRDKQWTRAKSFDTFCPLGPALVTRDELNPAALRVRSILNGRVMQDADTSDMIFSVPQLVSYLSRQFTLLPGTIILTGTPAGVGFARSPQVFLRPGDTITVEIDGIGSLTNPVIACPPPRIAAGEPVR